jgi:hypothetical protein
MKELQMLGATDIVISSNAVLNKNGEISYRQPPLADTGVAVYFTLNGEQRAIPCDKWIALEDNLHAIDLTVSALRGLERWGAKEMVDAAFRGFAALPAGGSNGAAWWTVLNVPANASKDEIEVAYRKLARQYHPDAGGDPQQFVILHHAYEQARGVR